MHPQFKDNAGNVLANFFGNFFFNLNYPGFQSVKLWKIKVLKIIWNNPCQLDSQFF